jgi:hypothetical protein
MYCKYKPIFSVEIVDITLLKEENYSLILLNIHGNKIFPKYKVYILGGIVFYDMHQFWWWAHFDDK